MSPAGPASDPEPRQRSVIERLAQLGMLAGALRADERRVGLRRTRRPDPGLARAVISWSTGATLDSVLRETDIAPGDFVRNVRQLIDLLRQLAQATPDRRTGEAAGQAVALLRRGVVGADDPAAVGSAPAPPAPS